MFIALLINPFFTLYHIIIHALFKSLLFLLSGSLIHIQYHYQSINKLKIKHTFIKTTLLFSASVLILSLAKESIIYYSNSVFSSLFIIMLLIIGTIYTIIYTFNIYLKCFYYSQSINQFKQSHIYYSFLIPFLIISSIFLDIMLEYSISLNIGTLFYTIDNATIITYLVINYHFTIICIIIPILPLPFTKYLWINKIRECLYYYSTALALILPVRRNGNRSISINRINANSTRSINIAALFRMLLLMPLLHYYSFSSNSTLSIPIYQDLLIFMSSYFIKGPINLFEVMSCLNYCYNLYHIHYFNVVFIIYLLLVFLLVLHAI
jgi:NADH:ubiquinone oxidoreductase subunit 5 (subunit L)/multisubunit Na+/H+ antiporter MnhA subunit